MRLAIVTSSSGNPQRSRFEQRHPRWDVEERSLARDSRAVARQREGWSPPSKLSAPEIGQPHARRDQSLKPDAAQRA